MQQLVTPVYNIPYYGGLCEGFVEGAVGQATLPYKNNGSYTTSGVWGNAVAPVNPGETAAWAENYNNGNHPNEQPPTGLYVPLYFSLGSTPAGHTALLLPDGRVASSTQSGYHTAPYIHPNMQDLINVYGKANNGCVYLGYSEYIGKLKIIGDTMNEEDISNIIGEIWGIPANANNVRDYTGASWHDFIYSILGVTTPWQDRKNNFTAVSQQNTELKKQIEVLEAGSGTDYVPVTNLYQKKGE